MCLCALERQKKSIFLHISSVLRASGETKAGLGTAAPFLSSFSSARQSVGFFFPSFATLLLDRSGRTRRRTHGVWASSQRKHF